MTSPAPTSTTRCRMRHSQNFDKIDSLLKPVLNIYVLGNLIVGCVCVGGGGGVVNKERAFILHQIYRFRESIDS